MQSLVPYDARRGAATPTTRELPSGLTYRPGDLVRLKNPVNGPFQAGQIVKITRAMETPGSATQRIGQTGKWKGEDGNTILRFSKREIQYELVDFFSPASGGGVVRHAHLSSNRNGVTPALTAYTLGAKVYIRGRTETKIYATIDNPVSQPPERYVVPAGTMGEIVAFATRTPGLAPPTQRRETTQNCYQVRFKVRKARWEEVICGTPKEPLNFEPLTPAERSAYLRTQQQPLPDPAFVSF